MTTTFTPQGAVRSNDTAPRTTSTEVITLSTLLDIAAAALPATLIWAAAREGIWRQRLADAGRDPLTGLRLRASWTRRAGRLLRRHRDVLVALVDMRGLKAVNDTLGHAAGDVLLAATGRRLATWADASAGIAARLGGDEFALLVPVDVDDLYATGSRVWALISELNQPVDLGNGDTLDAAATIGVALSHQLATTDLATLLHAADLAMYAARRDGKRLHIADPATATATAPTPQPLRRVRHHDTTPTHVNA